MQIQDCSECDKNVQCCKKFNDLVHINKSISEENKYLRLIIRNLKNTTIDILKEKGVDCATILSLNLPIVLHNLL